MSRLSAAATQRLEAARLPVQSSQKLTQSRVPRQKFSNVCDGIFTFRWHVQVCLDLRKGCTDYLMMA